MVSQTSARYSLGAESVSLASEYSGLAEQRSMGLGAVVGSVDVELESVFSDCRRKWA